MRCNQRPGPNQSQRKTQKMQFYFFFDFFSLLALEVAFLYPPNTYNRFTTSTGCFRRRQKHECFRFSFRFSFFPFIVTPFSVRNEQGLHGRCQVGPLRVRSNDENQRGRDFRWDHLQKSRSTTTNE